MKFATSCKFEEISIKSKISPLSICCRNMKNLKLMKYLKDLKNMKFITWSQYNIFHIFHKFHGFFVSRNCKNLSFFSTSFLLSITNNTWRLI
jgi:hypothetical protein